MKLYFHPGTNMAQAMAETIGYVTRSRAFMPPGTVSPFITRFDAGSVPVGYLVLSSETKSIGEIQDQALFKVRPMFASLPGVSAPPPFGGSQRTVVVRVDPDRLRSYKMSPDEVIKALTAGNAISPSGNVRIGDEMPIVPVNSLVRQVDELKTIPIRPGVTPTVYLRDVATVQDSSDVTTGYALVNGRRAVYILVTKRADASTLSVVKNVKAAIPSMQAVLPDDIKVSFEFDQSPTVTNAMTSLATEGALGAVLTGLMVLVFLRDWRSVIVVVLNIPFALCGAVVALWLTGQTVNLMTLGGLALAIGILVDEATVEIENIHAQDGTHGEHPARSGRGTSTRPCRGSWRCSASSPSSSRRSSCKGRHRPSSSRSRSPSASRWSRPTCSPAPSSPSSRSGCSGTGTSPKVTRRGVRPSTGSATPTGEGSGGSSGSAGWSSPRISPRPGSSPTASGGSSAWRSSRGSTPAGSSFGSRRRPERGSRRPSGSPGPPSTP